MELQIIKKEMFFLLLYGFMYLNLSIKSFLALCLLMIGLYEYNGMYYLFEWIWLLYFGKILSMIFLIKEESNNEEERESLLQEEISEHKQTYIPWKSYAINALIETADIFLICIELFFMNFGLFIICQGIVFVSYSQYKNQLNKLTIIYSSVVLLAGIFSMALHLDGNHECYIGLIATLLQIGTNIYAIKLKEEFMSQYVFQHSKYISYTGLIQFLLWIIVLVIVNFIHYPNYSSQNNQTTCPSNKNLGDFNGFFCQTFSNKQNNNIAYPVIVFVILILISSLITYMDNKITIKLQSDKKQIIQQFVFFPVWIWIYSDYTHVTLFVFCILFFISQWLIGLYLIFNDKKTENHKQIEEDQDSEFS